MSFNLTIHNDLSCINDDDLNLDLGDDDEFIKPQAQIATKTDNNNNKNDHDDDDFQFKIPDPIPQKKKNVENTEETHFQNNLETTLDNLFDNDEEDEEDFLIRTQSFFSSTQSTSDCLPVNFCPPDPDIFIQNPNVVQDSIISTQSAGELMRKPNRTDVTINLDNTIDEFNDFTVWKYSQSDLSKILSSMGLDSDLLKKYTLDYYHKKVRIF